LVNSKRGLGALLALVLGVAPAAAQPPDAPHVHAGSEPATLFPARDVSGTAWGPDSAPMFAAHARRGAWELMLHWHAFAQFLYESGEAHHGSRQAGGINWMMAHARRPIGTARLGVRAMVSAEPGTIGGCGYPNLLATGEVCDGDTIHDLQHPHDLFMEVAAEYDAPIAGGLRWQLYGGPAGEPALGPPAFPHRASAFANPIAPIAHHWLDSTHTAFGVVTAGLFTPRWKVEASAFNGREPDADRTDFDLAALDSVSGRLWLLPTADLALQVSAGRLNGAEEGLPGQPRTDVTRATASLTYHRRQAAANRDWAATAAYGMNAESSPVPGGRVEERTHAVLVEGTVTIADRHAVFGRLEVAGKPAHDLHVHELITSIFTVGKLQGGYTRDLPAWRGVVAGLGGTAAATFLPAALAPRYGGRVAPGFGVFLTVRPARHQ
jgi:hypothetical protein